MGFCQRKLSVSNEILKNRFWYIKKIIHIWDKYQKNNLNQIYSEMKELLVELESGSKLAFVDADNKAQIKKIAEYYIELDGKVVAYAHYCHTSKEYDNGTFKKDNLQSFGRVMVDDGYTGLHIGRFLVGNMIEEAKKIIDEKVFIRYCSLCCYSYGRGKTRAYLSRT